MWLYIYSRSSADNFIVKASDLKEETNEIDTEGEDLSENTSTDSENYVLDLGMG